MFYCLSQARVPAETMLAQLLLKMGPLKLRKNYLKKNDEPRSTLSEETADSSKIIIQRKASDTSFHEGQ